MTDPSSPPAPMTAGRLDQCAWLIECRIGPESTYIQLKSREELSQEWEEEIHARGYDAAKKLKPWHFTKDASSATRFAREEDAARAMVALGMQGPTGLLDWLRPTEHMWSDAAHPDVSNVPALTARVAELEGAIRKFPHFENDEPITAEAISNVAGEHVDMIMSWVPVQTKIAFVDDDGRQFEIVYEDGDSDAGIPSGWCVPEDADWQPARRGIESELAEARKVDDAEVVEAVDWLLDRAECSSVTLDPSPMGPIADLLTRLSAALKEAERRETEAKTLQHQLASDLTVAVARAEAARITTP